MITASGFLSPLAIQLLIINETYFVSTGAGCSFLLSANTGEYNNRGEGGQEGGRGMGWGPTGGGDGEGATES